MGVSEEGQGAVEEEETKEEKAADSFVNDIYTSERKQEPCDEMANEKEQEDTKDEAQEEEKAADSFINNIYTSEGRQEPCDDLDEEEGDAEHEQKETKESNNEDVQGEKGIFKLKKDLETEDQDSRS